MCCAGWAIACTCRRRRTARCTASRSSRASCASARSSASGSASRRRSAANNVGASGPSDPMSGSSLPTARRAESRAAMAPRMPRGATARGPIERRMDRRAKSGGVPVRPGATPVGRRSASMPPPRRRATPRPIRRSPSCSS